MNIMPELPGEKNADQVHRLCDKATRHADIDRSLLSIAGQHPDLDTRKLQCVDRIRYSLL